jgi:hypothetical protein
VKLGRKYLAQLQNAGKIKKVVRLAAGDMVSCSKCGHGARRHYPPVPGWEEMSAIQLTKLIGGLVPLGSRRYCPGMSCRDCDFMEEALRCQEAHA